MGWAELKHICGMYFWMQLFAALLPVMLLAVAVLWVIDEMEGFPWQRNRQRSEKHNGRSA